MKVIYLYPKMTIYNFQTDPKKKGTYNINDMSVDIRLDQLGTLYLI